MQVRKRKNTYSNTAPTLVDVARRAGVSSATVSRVLNRPEAVSSEAAGKVRRAMKELHYAPNMVARSLKIQQTTMVGIIVPNILNPFFARIVKGVEQVLNEHRYLTVIFDTEENSPKEERYLRDLIERRTDGIIIVPSRENTGMPRILSGRKLPVVFVDRYFSREFDSVKGNNYGGISLLVSHLVERGYRRIAHLGGPSETLPGRERKLAFIQSLALHGLGVRDDFIRSGEFTIDEGYAQTRLLMKVEDPPEAIVAANNFLGIGALQALKESGWKVPRDIGLVIFDEVFLADLADPPLTVAVQPAEEMGRIAAEMLMERVKSKHPLSPREVVLEPRLIVRGSTRMKE